MSKKIIFPILISLSLISCASVIAVSVKSNELDACYKQLPSSLLSALKKTYSEYRIVTASDYAHETIEWEKQYHDGNECLSVTKGDFDGNNEIDFAILLTDASENEILIAARSSKSSWIIEKLLDFNQGRLGTSYVNKLPPGNYEDIWGGGEEIGRVKRIFSDKQGIITGTIESSGVAYFYYDNRWIHLWLSD